MHSQNIKMLESLSPNLTSKEKNYFDEKRFSSLVDSSFEMERLGEERQNLGVMQNRSLYLVKGTSKDGKIEKLFHEITTESDWRDWEPGSRKEDTIGTPKYISPEQQKFVSMMLKGTCAVNSIVKSGEKYYSELIPNSELESNKELLPEIDSDCFILRQLFEDADHQYYTQPRSKKIRKGLEGFSRLRSIKMSPHTNMREERNIAVNDTEKKYYMFDFSVAFVSEEDVDEALMNHQGDNVRRAYRIHQDRNSLDVFKNQLRQDISGFDTPNPLANKYATNNHSIIQYEKMLNLISLKAKKLIADFGNTEGDNFYNLILEKAGFDFNDVEFLVNDSKEEKKMSEAEKKKLFYEEFLRRSQAIREVVGEFLGNQKK